MIMVRGPGEETSENGTGEERDWEVDRNKGGLESWEPDFSSSSVAD